MPSSEKKIFKKVLKNGLVVLVRPTHTVPKVSTQLWYNVGSKDEKSNEKGIAHLIEHMIFKGTKILSESDINMITHKLSGSCNAFTSYDYTGYLFDFPTQHWHEALPIMADCMVNCTFKQDYLNSEMKAVIQELKMYRDSYISSLIEEMISAIFVDHPYHYPIIGFKHDLWNLKRDRLLAFYKKHYVPNNAALVVVGDVDPEDVFAHAQKSFGTIPANTEYRKEEYTFSPDIGSKAVTLYRDVQQPFAVIAYVIPGQQSKKDYAIDVLCWLLGLGKSSRLQHKLIHELQLVTELEAFAYDLFEHGILFIYFQPTDMKNYQKIVDMIQQEIDNLAENISDTELERAQKQAKATYLSVLEDNQKQAYTIGQAFTATGDENFIFTYLDYPQKSLKDDIKAILHTYCRSAVRNQGTVLPLAEKDQDLWRAWQEKSDQEDARVLSAITRETTVEQGVHVHTIQVQPQPPFNFPKAQKITLPNGLKLLFYNNPNVPKIDILIDLPTRHFADPHNKEGLSTFMSNLLAEGTKNYSSQELAQEIESYGMSFSAMPGSISMGMLSQDLEKGLELLHEIITNATFQQDSIEKVRTQLKAEIKNYWDQPAQFANQLVREYVYKGHPYSKRSLGTVESVANISRDDILSCYKQQITPRGATIAIVGDLGNYNVPALVSTYLSSWHGTEVQEIVFPPLAPVTATTIDYPINRDQIVLCYAGLSVPRMDPAYDKILLFNQIFTGGALGSMSSRLFELREQSGLFYTISGSLLANADEQPGMLLVKTIVSLDRLTEAEKAIEQTIDTATNTILETELEEAKNALASALIDNFSSNQHIASTFLYIERFGFPANYFDNRGAQLQKIGISEIQEAVRKILDTKKLVKLRVGRIA